MIKVQPPATAGGSDQMLAFRQGSAYSF